MASTASSPSPSPALPPFLPSLPPVVVVVPSSPLPPPPAAFVRSASVPASVRPPLTVVFDPPPHPHPHPTVRPTATALLDINGWRDTSFDFPGSIGIGSDTGHPPREVCVLPFPYTNVLLQGETKHLRLYEDRFLSLFDECNRHHCGVVAMGLLAESGIIQTVPLCEVEDRSTVDIFGSPSVFCTIRAVGRATLLEITQQEPYVKAVCVELTDDVPPNLELPTIVAGNVENFIVDITGLERRLDEAGGGGGGGKAESAGDGGGAGAGDDNGGGPMRDRILRARLEDVFYRDDPDDDGEDDDDDDDDDCDDGSDDAPLDRIARFREALRTAEATDAQGYTVSAGPTPGGRGGAATPSSSARSARDLTAVSWAAFCTDPPVDNHGGAMSVTVTVDEDGNEYGGVPLMPTAKSVTYRIRALDCSDLFERLKLASFMLRERKAELEELVRGLGGGGGGGNGEGGKDGGEQSDEEL